MKTLPLFLMALLFLHPTAQAKADASIDFLGAKFVHCVNNTGNHSFWFGPSYGQAYPIFASIDRDGDQVLLKMYQAVLKENSQGPDADYVFAQANGIDLNSPDAWKVGSVFNVTFCNEITVGAR